MKNSSTNASNDRKGLSVYIHYPFCLKKCNYCDFVSIPDRIDDGLVESAFLKAIGKYEDMIAGRHITTVFFGGGTPSLMPETLVEKILAALDANDASEISMEVNPKTIDRNKMLKLKETGINRISIGVQALNDNDLAILGRIHSVKDALQCLDDARNIFPKVSCDFIYARPGQSSKQWGNELEEILKLEVPHMSLYQLTIDNGWDAVIPGEDDALRMFEISHEMLEKSGYSHYEISNYAKTGHESQHNLHYWRMDDYLGIGPGAHSRIDGKAMEDSSDIRKWLETQDAHIETLTRRQVLEEKVLMGLRIKEGVRISDEIMGIINKDALDEFVKSQLLNIDSSGIKPTFKGYKILDYITYSLLS